MCIFKVTDLWLLMNTHVCVCVCNVLESLCLYTDIFLSAFQKANISSSVFNNKVPNN